MQTKAMMAAVLLMSATPALAQKTGLKRLTKKELLSMQKDLGMRRIKSIRPNSLGIARANEERLKRGLSPLPSSQMKVRGKETVVDQELNDFTAGSSTTEESTDFFAGALPTAVDNSKLSAFPPIGAQSVNNCVGWAMGYYQQSHNLALTLGHVNNTTDQTTKCSPKFIYNMINGGVDNGAYFSHAFSMLQKHGCVNNASFPENSEYRSWNLNPDQWQAALSGRTNPVQYVNYVDTQTGLDQLKQLLTNGYVLTFGTYINSWQYSTIKGGTLSGLKAMHWMNGTDGGHAMTIVGYDDSQWVDINNNGVQDSGEMGVLKIANSWGTSWGHSGFMYVAYDSLKATSAVTGAPSTGRVAAFQGNLAYHQVPRATYGNPYKPKYLAKFTVHHGARNQLALKFGSSDSSYTYATSTFAPFAIYNKGGAYAFNGTTTAVNGTFVMDLSDLPISNTYKNKIYATMSDNTSGSSATLSNFTFLDQVNNIQASASLSAPVATDASSVTVSLLHDPATSNSAPVASFSANTYSGTAPLTVSLDASSSYDPDGTIHSYHWNFGDGTTATGAYVSHTYGAGTWTATLTVTDDDGAATSKSATIKSSSATDTTAPAVKITSPADGARIKAYSYFTATADATDNVGVNRVKFYYGGYWRCTDYSAPYSCSIKMKKTSGTSVYARAYDAAGNYKTSTKIYVKSY